jgi:cation diffusion facilitator family transporter
VRPAADAAAVERAARVSVVTGVAVLALKVLAWRVTGSVALESDALESIVNVVAALAMWAAVRYAARPADDDHPFGHGKAEYLSAALEGAMVLVAAALILREALPRVLHPTPARAFGAGMAWSIGASAINGGLGWYLLRRGRALRSVALEADGRHVLTDVVTSGGVLLGFTAAQVTGWWALDAILAVLVALHIVGTGYALVRRSVGGLMDEALEPQEAAALEALVAQAAREGGALEVHGFRARHAGARVFCEAHMVVPGEMTVAAAHGLCDDVERALAGAHPHAEVTIHVEPPDEAAAEALR